MWLGTKGHHLKFWWENFATLFSNVSLVIAGILPATQSDTFLYCNKTFLIVCEFIHNSYPAECFHPLIAYYPVTLKCYSNWNLLTSSRAVVRWRKFWAGCLLWEARWIRTVRSLYDTTVAQIHPSLISFII